MYGNLATTCTRYHMLILAEIAFPRRYFGYSVGVVQLPTYDGELVPPKPPQLA